MTAGLAARRLTRLAGATVGAAVAAGAARYVQRRTQEGPARLPRRPVGPTTIPEWVLPTDVLASRAEAEQHVEVADGLLLPLVLDEVEAWDALGTLAALVRLVDDGRRESRVVALGGRRSGVGRFCRAAGFRVVSTLPAEPGAVDLLARTHPDRVSADEVDALLEVAATALRPGGILVLSVPVGDVDAPGAMGRADLRAVEARAHDLGLVLVGDLDGEVGRRLTAAVHGAREDADGRRPGTAYALARLTLRRR